LLDEAFIHLITLKILVDLKIGIEEVNCFFAAATFLPRDLNENVGLVVYLNFVLKVSSVWIEHPMISVFCIRLFIYLIE